MVLKVVIGCRYVGGVWFSGGGPGLNLIWAQFVIALKIGDFDNPVLPRKLSTRITFTGGRL
jgi:hypothetical protein